MPDVGTGLAHTYSDTLNNVVEKVIEVEFAQHSADIAIEIGDKYERITLMEFLQDGARQGGMALGTLIAKGYDGLFIGGSG